MPCEERSASGESEPNAPTGSPGVGRWPYAGGLDDAPRASGPGRRMGVFVRADDV